MHTTKRCNRHDYTPAYGLVKGLNQSISRGSASSDTRFAAVQDRTTTVEPDSGPAVSRELNPAESTHKREEADRELTQPTTYPTSRTSETQQSTSVRGTCGSGVHSCGVRGVRVTHNG